MSAPSCSFEDLKLNPQLLRAVEEAGYGAPTPIQQRAIPLALGGQDVVGIAQTGTGKTAAYVLPLLMRLKCAVAGPPRGLILATSKELVLQIGAQLGLLGRYTDVRHACLYGGVGPTEQLRQLRAGVDVLVTTPGRLLDLYHRGAFQLRGVRQVVLDEGDRLLTRGFWPQLQSILELLPRRRQQLLFSATMSAQVQELSAEFMGHPVEVMITPQATPVATVVQQCYAVPNVATKARLLGALLSDRTVFRRVMVFTRTRKAAVQVASFLTRKGGEEVRVLHANKAQATRINALRAFAAGEVRVLVATDVAARGIDVDEVSHVINFEVPHWPEEYVHRIGRTGRAARVGAALTLMDPSEGYYMRRIEQLMGQKVAMASLPEGVEVVPTEREEAQAQARTIDLQRQREDPTYRGAFHPKKKKNQRQQRGGRRG